MVQNNYEAYFLQNFNCSIHTYKRGKTTALNGNRNITKLRSV